LTLQANPVSGKREGAPWRAALGLSLRARLLLLVVASLMPLLAFSLVSQYLEYRQAVAATGQQTLELARSMTLVVERELQARMVALQVLALAPTLRGDDIAAFRDQAQAVIAQQFPGSNLILLREDGQQLMNTLLPPDAALPVRPNLESLRQVFATAAPAVSDLYMGAIGPRLVVAIDVPVKTDEVARVLIAAGADREASERDKARARAALGESEEKLRQSQKMEAVGQLTGGLAHDFNNLLLVIIGNLDDLIDSKSNAPAEQELARQALEAAQRGADLIRSLLAFARRQPLQPRRIAINDLMRTIAKLLARTLGERIAVTLELAPDVWPVVADPAQLEAALTNLATNARDAMPRGGRLTIATANRHLDADYGSQHAEVAPGDYALIEVSDTGSGMPPELLAQIFDPFFTTKAQGEGTGLGLSMVFGFIKQSGGHINVYSEPSAGTTFRLYLPRDRTADLPDREDVTAASPPGGGESVLVVEDNPALRAIVVMQLTRLGYRVSQSESAAAAIAVLEQDPQRIDLLLADVVMPGKLDGYDLARIVRQRWPATRILMTSGFPGTRLDHATTVAADIPLLTKPYRRAALAQALRDALGNSRPGSGPPARG
jgi:signal transduction histidine kinase/ActR/RegA family two-component response regulator